MEMGIFPSTRVTNLGIKRPKLWPFLGVDWQIRSVCSFYSVFTVLFTRDGGWVPQLICNSVGP